MDAHGRAIGFSDGHDVCYPKENKKLYEKYWSVRDHQ